MTELTWLLKWIASTLSVLTVLYLVTWLLLRLLTRLARQSAAQTDLDLIGQEARVTRTIRPGHAGRILYTAEGKTIHLAASSTQRLGGRFSGPDHRAGPRGGPDHRQGDAGSCFRIQFDVKTVSSLAGPHERRAPRVALVTLNSQFATPAWPCASCANGPSIRDFRPTS